MFINLYFGEKNNRYAYFMAYGIIWQIISHKFITRVGFFLLVLEEEEEEENFNYAIIYSNIVIIIEINKLFVEYIHNL